MFMCVRGINFIGVSMIFLLDIGTVLTMWYLLCVYYTTEQSFNSNTIQNNVQASILFVFTIFLLGCYSSFLTPC